MSESTELKLPKKYKRPSLEAFRAAGYSDYTEQEYLKYFEEHEANLAELFAAGAVTEENFRSELDEEMEDADGDGLPDMLHVKSQVRAQGNRTLRARHPTRHRFKQYLFADPSKRLVRKRPLKVSAADVRKNLDELLAKEAAGILSVHAPNGQRVNLQALKAGRVELGALPPVAPPVNKPLDSAANDLPSGNPIPTYLEGSFPGDPIAQEIGRKLAAEKKAESDKKTGEGEEEAPEVPETPAAPAAAAAAEAPAINPTDPADPTAPVTDEAREVAEGIAAVSTELEQPPTGVEGEATPVQNQLPTGTEASVEASVDPVAETEPAATVGKKGKKGNR